MNGFDVVPLEQPGAFRRLLGGKLKSNALREIHNLLAQRSLHDLTAADVEGVLSEYEVPRHDAADGLKQLYQAALEFRVNDLELSDEDIADLRHLRYVFGLGDDEAKSFEVQRLGAHYRAALVKALEDGHLTDREKARLDAMAVNFGLPESVRKEVHQEEVLRVLEDAFNAAVADQRLTPGEEERLAKMSENLGMRIAHGAETQRLLSRYRTFAQIENGQLPTISAPILLQRGELCHAQFPCVLQELRTVTKAIRYHGPAGSIRIMKGLRWRYGSVSVNRVTTEQLRVIDSGVLFITNKRLLFNGSTKNVALPLKRVIHFTLFRDGIQIEKDSGRDQFYKGDGDVELFGAILDGALRAVR